MTDTPNMTPGTSVTNNPDEIPSLDQILRVFQTLSEETVEYIKNKYPTRDEFEKKFLSLSFEAIKTCSKDNGKEEKEPQFKRSDLEELIILGRFAKEKTNEENRTIGWEDFNEMYINDLREKAPRNDLDNILRILGFDNSKAANIKDRGVHTPLHFVQKPMSWFGKLESSPGNKLLNETDNKAIERFKQWYTFHMVGYLPPGWVASFRNDEINNKELKMRKVLHKIGLSADVIYSLKMNGITSIATLNDDSKYWQTTKKSSEEKEDISNSWQRMGLARDDAKEIINFRHWYNFYVAGLDVPGWVSKFNKRQYDSFIQQYQPGDNFRMLSWWKFWQTCKCWGPDNLKFPLERHGYYDVLRKAADSGDVSNEHRYHLRKCYEEKREKMSLMEEIATNNHEGIGDTSQQEERLNELLQHDDSRADENSEENLLCSQNIDRFYLSGILVFTLIGLWIGTTVWFMVQYWKSGVTANAMEVGRQSEESLYPSLSFSPSEEHQVNEQHPGFEFIAFVHNVLFGLVSAVAIQELGEEPSHTSLYHRFLPTLQEKLRRRRAYRIRRNWETSIMSRWRLTLLFIDVYVTLIILQLIRYYILLWIFLGCASLAFAAVGGLDTSNPLYITGQTWLGIAVTIGYSYFGLNSQSSTTSADDVDAATANDPSSDRRGDGADRDDNHASYSQESDHNNVESDSDREPSEPHDQRV